MRVGLTGGIGSGKSVVAARLHDLGAVVIDADAIARDLVEPGQPALDAVRAEFGPDVVGPDGRLDRAALAAIVFADPDRLAALNAIMHPRIAERTAGMIAAAPPDAVVVYDMPLLVENGLTGDWDLIVVVDCPDDVRLDRLVRGRGMRREDALARMAAQVSRDQRRAVADVVIDNSGSIDDLHRQVTALWGRLTAPV